MKADLDTFSSRVGRWYEIAAKTGLVRALLEWLPLLQCSTAARSLRADLDQLIEELDQYRFDPLVQRVIDYPEAAPELIDAVGAYLESLAMQASLTTYGAIREYLKYLNGLEGRNQRLGLDDILLLQCPVLGEFGVGDREDVLETKTRRVNRLLDHPMMVDQWSRAGEFLNADVLMLAATRSGLNLLVADMSCAALRSPEQVLRLQTPEGLAEMLERDTHYMEAKAVFTPCNFESGDLSFDLSKKLGDYFKAFSTKDKEPTKIIQAMSYSESFITALERQGCRSLPADWQSTLQVNAMAITNRDIETVNVGIANRDLLRAARLAYRRSRGVTSDD